ncbi:MAG: SEC-C metal-binding domain-containing protein [Hyphomicrobiaceae bacterium]
MSEREALATRSHLPCARSGPRGPAPPRVWSVITKDGGVPWLSSAAIPTKCPAFEVSSKRRKSFPSETRVKRGRQIVHGDVELVEKLGRNDLCPCGSGARFQALLPAQRPLRRLRAQALLSERKTDRAAARHRAMRAGVMARRPAPSPGAASG